MLNYGKFLYPPTVKVIVTDEKNVTKPFSDDYEIKCRIFGYSLIDILLEESAIKLSENDGSVILNRIFTGNSHGDATRLMGSIAEILVTKFCNEYQ